MKCRVVFLVLYFSYALLFLFVTAWRRSFLHTVIRSNLSFKTGPACVLERSGAVGDEARAAVGDFLGDPRQHHVLHDRQAGYVKPDIIIHNQGGPLCNARQSAILILVWFLCVTKNAPPCYFSCLSLVLFLVIFSWTIKTIEKTQTSFKPVLFHPPPSPAI